MSLFQWLLYIFVTLFLVYPISCSNSHRAHDHRRRGLSLPTIFVNPLAKGKGNYKTIQAAIDSVPSNNRNWVCIYIKQGTYREKVHIPFDKPFIYLKGEGKRRTTVIWGDHGSIATSATFTSQADYIIVKSITFVNSYNYPSMGHGNSMKAAVAAMIEGDKSVFYRCGFVGLQDTLWDVQGRHYFKLCTIQGAVDFIFGSGQSLYERCTLSVTAGALNGPPGYITAQGRSSPKEPNGFIFKDCNIVGNGKTYLGRPWRGFARVVFYNTSMSQIIVPEGWDAWFSLGREYQLTYAEYDCHGVGSNTSRRVKWANNVSKNVLSKFTTISFIDSEGWLKDGKFNVPPRIIIPGSAPDSVPSSNKDWVLISIRAGVYNEHVEILEDKPFIHLKGEGMGRTIVVWGAHENMLTSSTFASAADNIMVSGITFVNSYNYPPDKNDNPVKPAVAAMISGDKSAFYECSFLGYQDTLLDDIGRHYFKSCKIEGSTDFIFGGGQSIYEQCVISVNGGVVDPYSVGYIAANARAHVNDSSGFVFKRCNVTGAGKTYLGRAWKAYSRVIFSNSFLSDNIIPQGWDAWDFVGQEDHLTFAEYECDGSGSDMSSRVTWEKNLSPTESLSFTSNAFIDTDGWLHKLPLDVLD